MKKALLSLIVITAVAGIAYFGYSKAFFSDTETSAGNLLVAGEIDLKIDNESYIDQGDGLKVSESTTWGIPAGLDDPLGLFFNFTDLKPGDLGEDTISIHLSSNPAWLCADLDITANSDETCTEPENDNVGGEASACVVETDGINGDLAGQLNFIFWEDDGDNVLENQERILTQGPASNVLNGVTWALADSQTGTGDPLLPTEEVPYFIGKAWCFGALTTNPLLDEDTGPLERGNSILCDGSLVNNIAQTDKLMGDITFRAVQARHNDEFVCERPEGEQRPLVGAALGSYDDPSVCTQTVNLADSLQAAINAAGTTGDTICVDPSYTGAGDVPSVIEVNKLNLTIAGLGVSGAATVAKGLHIDANGVTVKGLTLNSYPQIESSENAAIYINSAITGTTVSFNKFVPVGDAKAANAKGVITEIGNGSVAGASGISITHNLFQSWNQGMFFNTANYDVGFNDVYDNNVGIANDGPHASLIHNNDFEDNDSEAVGVAPSAINGTSNNGLLTVNTNNFTPTGAGNNVNWYGSSILGAEDVNAENNFWAGEADAARTNNTAEVDTNPFAVVAFPEN